MPDVDHLSSTGKTTADTVAAGLSGSVQGRGLRRHWRAGVAALLLLGWCGMGTAQGPFTEPVSLPALGDSGGGDLTAGAERRLGDRIMREVWRDPDLLDDPVLQDYLDSLWRPLVAAARGRGDLSDELREHFAWQAFLVRDRTVNAFALPGGYIGIHLGLIGVTSTRDELAAVMAHELSHITQRHIARSIEVGKRQTMLSVAAVLLGVMAASRSPDAANAMIAGGQAVAVQGQLNFSRDMEREADRIGFGVLTGAGYAAAGMPGMFGRLDQASRLNDAGQYPYLRSHPLTSERIAEAQSRADQVTGGPFNAAPVNPASSTANPNTALWLHAVMQGRARVLMDSRSQSLSRWLGGVNAAASSASAQANTPEALAVACSAAMAAQQLKDWRAADKALARARTLAAGQGEPVVRAVKVLQIESLLERGQPLEASKVLGGEVLDGSRAGLLLGARLALVAGAQAQWVPPPWAAQVREDLQTWVSGHPLDGSAWLALAQLYERADQPLAALRAHAEARYAVGDWSGAVDRLRAGQRLARSQGRVETLEGIVIESRLKAIEQQRRQEAEQERRG